jgi:hypothetical protein
MSCDYETRFGFPAFLRLVGAFGFFFNSIQVGAWSLVFSHLRTSRSTPEETSIFAALAPILFMPWYRLKRQDTLDAWHQHATY